MSDLKFTQDDLDRLIGERLAAERTKNATIVGELKTQLAERDAVITTLKPRAEAADQAVRELQDHKEGAVRADAFRHVGLDGEDAAAKRERLVKYHASIEAKDDKGEPIPFATWLREHAASDPLMGVHVKPPTGTTTTPAPAPGTRPVVPPPTTKVTGDDPANKRLTPEQARAEHTRLLQAGQHKEAREFLATLLTGQ